MGVDLAAPDHTTLSRRARRVPGRRRLRAAGDLRSAGGARRPVRDPDTGKQELGAGDRRPPVSGTGTAQPQAAIRYKSFQCQADSWTTPRRVVAKVEHHVGELFPRVGFIVTNLPIHNRAVVRFYNKRGTAEQWIKEGKQATHWNAAVVPSISSERGPAAAERIRVQLGESVAAAGPADGLSDAIQDTTKTPPTVRSFEPAVFIERARLGRAGEVLGWAPLASTLEY